MPKMTTAEADIEKQIDAVLEKRRAEQDEKARAAVRAQLIEKERLAREAEEQAAQGAAREAYLERARAAHGQLVLNTNSQSTPSATLEPGFRHWT